MRRHRITDDRGQPIRLYGSPVAFFHVGDGTIPPDAQRRIERRARRRWRGLGVALGLVALQLLLFGGYMLGIRWAIQSSAAQIYRALIAVSVPFLIASVATTWLTIRFVRRARTGAYIGAFLAERRCPSCAYDLQGVKPTENGFVQCPECGAACNMKVLERPPGRRP